MSDTATAKRVRFERKTIIHVIFLVFFALSVLAPLFTMLFHMTGEGMRSVFSSPLFLPALKNSVLTALTATVISELLALAAAYAVERSGVRATSLWSVIFVIPMLIPSISHAFGIISLFGNNGFITKLFHSNGSIYGFWGIVLGSVMYSFPVAFMMISGILRYEDSMQYKAARVLGIPFWRRMTAITFPFLRKTLITTFFAVFTMIVTDYGVPLAIGGKAGTLSTLMYNTAVANVNYDNGSVIGAILLVPAVIAFVADVAFPEKNQSGFVTEGVETNSKHWVKAISYAFCVLVSVFVLLPILAFCFMSFAAKYPVDMTFTFSHITDTISRGAGELLLYSLLYSFLVALFGTVIAFLCAYATARLRGKISRFVHLFAIMSMAIPGIVLGLSYLLFFNKSFLYGTIFIVVLVNTIHFFSSPYLMMYNSLSKVNESLEDVGASLGISRWKLVLSVIVPKVLYTLLEMFVYFFVNSMMTISAISFLAPPAPKSVALMINQFESQLLMESAAFVSLLILAVNVIVKGMLIIYRRIRSRRGDE